MILSVCMLPKNAHPELYMAFIVSVKALQIIHWPEAAHQSLD